MEQGGGFGVLDGFENVVEFFVERVFRFV